MENVVNNTEMCSVQQDRLLRGSSRLQCKILWQWQWRQQHVKDLFVYTHTHTTYEIWSQLLSFKKAKRAQHIIRQHRSRTPTIKQIVRKPVFTRQLEAFLGHFAPFG